VSPLESVRIAPVNELVEAKQQLQLRRVLARSARYDVIAIDLCRTRNYADTGQSQAADELARYDLARP
jgi:hypothetical protein